jgi:hypothetical protein
LTVGLALFTTLALAALPQKAAAQVGIAVAGGPVLPTGELADAVDTGIHAGLVLRFRAPLIPVTLGAGLMGYYMPGTGDLRPLRQVSGILDGQLRLLPIPVLTPYLVAGVGLYGSSHDVDPDLDPSFAWHAGLAAGLGIGVDLLIEAFVEARYHYVFAPDARTFVPLSVGIYF